MATHDNDEHMKKHRDQGIFSVKHAISQVAGNCCRKGGIEFAQGAIEGCIAELVFLMGEREAFEFVMKKAESIIREPSAAGGLWTPGNKE